MKGTQASRLLFFFSRPEAAYRADFFRTDFGIPPPIGVFSFLTFLIDAGPKENSE